MHRHVTNPIVSKADHITVAAKELTDAIKNNLKYDISKMNMNELERLAEIFEKAAKKVSEENASTPRVQNESNAAPRVQRESAAAPRVPEGTIDKDLDDIPALRYVTDDEDSDSDDKDEDAPTPRVTSTSTEDEPIRRYNLQGTTRGNIMTDVMLSVVKFGNTKLAPQRLASRRFPMQFLCEIAGAVMDEDTGDMLEYRHLVKIPKYRVVWTKAFGKEIGRLAQRQKGVVEGTNALYFIPYADVPVERRKDITYARICADQIRTEFE
jgi:hypothetical protein